ncbi:hypothetical protein EC600_03290 [Helicobacter pylori]|nr:hypothetical protein [Helicobacter pylori]RVZ97253.1 hypothetical protein EC600_03290 [Helicobacter pylori]
MFSAAGVTIFIIFCFVVLSFFGGVVLSFFGGVVLSFFGGVVLFFFGKGKTILDAMMNIIFVIIVACIFCPWLLGLLFYMFGFLALHVIPY